MYITTESPSLPRKRRSTFPLFPDGSVANWTRGTAGCSSPPNWTLEGSEMTRGPLGEALGCGSSQKRPAPAASPAPNARATGRRGSSKRAAPSRRRLEAAQKPSRQSTQRTTKIPNWRSQAKTAAR